jgi:cytochrome c peroxidase
MRRKKVQAQQASLSNYAAPALPAYYDATVSALDNTPPQDPVDDKIATLGRVLFYDKQLSVNNTVSCASCHSQANGFDDSQRFSVGFEGNAFTTAHAMRLGNSSYYRPGDTFWDRRAESLEAQASRPQPWAGHANCKLHRRGKPGPRPLSRTWP